MILGVRNMIKTLVPNAGRMMWLCIGCLSLGLGGLGAVLPVLPTTPFVILAAFAFGRSSPRLQAFLEDSPAFGPIISHWQAQGAIAPRFKVLSIVMMAAVLGISLVLSVPLIVLIVQLICMTGAALFILSRPNPAV